MRQGFYINYFQIMKIAVGVLLAVAVFELDDETIDVKHLPIKESTVLFLQKLKRIFNRIIFSPSSAQTANKELSKVLKEAEGRRNFASRSAGARVVYKSAGINHANALLEESSSVVMIFPCEMASKTRPMQVVIDMSEDFYMDEILLVSKSLFANHIEEFKIETSLGFPSEQWIDLGHYKNSVTQLFTSFSFDKSYLTRFLKLTILSVDNENNFYYCAINQIRVFGKTLSYSAKKRNEQIIKIENDLNTAMGPSEMSDLGPESNSASNEKTLSEAEMKKEKDAFYNKCKNLDIKEAFEYLILQKTHRKLHTDPYMELTTFFADSLTQILQRLKSLESGFSERVTANSTELNRKLLNREDFLNMVLAEQNKQLRQHIGTLEKRVVELESKQNREASKRKKTKQRSNHIADELTTIINAYNRDRTTMEDKIRTLEKSIKSVETEQDFFEKLSLILGMLIIACLALVGGIFRRNFN